MPFKTVAVGVLELAELVLVGVETVMMGSRERSGRYCTVFMMGRLNHLRSSLDLAVKRDVKPQCWHGIAAIASGYETLPVPRDQLGRSAHSELRLLDAVSQSASLHCLGDFCHAEECESGEICRDRRAGR